MADQTTIRIDLRTVLPIAGFTVVIFVIIFVELCGRESVKPLSGEAPTVIATAAPTFTPGPSVTAALTAEATPTATEAAPGVGAAERDAQRVQDLSTIAAALQQYFQKHKSYPNTKEAIQSFCVYRDSDQGCKLEEFLKPLPFDPLGTPGQNGYWLESTETNFTVYAQSETAPAQPCPQHPAHLARFPNVICVRGP